MRTIMGGLARALTTRYRCPESVLPSSPAVDLAGPSGFFRFGPNATCYGRLSEGCAAGRPDASSYDALGDVVFSDHCVTLPFDPSEVIDNFLLEHYASAQSSKVRRIAKGAYYLLRPIFSQKVRKQIQRWQLLGWDKLRFPGWPVDTTVEDVYEQLLLLALNAGNSEKLPFIWFWPHQFSAAVVMTHDVESESGRDFCPELMDIDDSFGVKASFEIVPEGNYSVSQEFLAAIRARGCEVGIQDLNHDGSLFDDRDEFLRRANLINEWASKFGARGFRAAVLYRNQDWFDALRFSFDMSIPNTARLDPQRGGCCTVMPYFIGKILELPVTTTQDYMLFHLIGRHSIELWKEQTELILAKNGLASFIVHPDYVIDDKVRKMYKELLTYLQGLKATRNVWMALPSEVDRWWRERAELKIVPDGGGWRIEGEGSARARLAYARNLDGNLVYELEPVATTGNE
jgi:hypothetical protein